MASKRNFSTKTTQFGRNRSHSLKATPRRFKPNLQMTRIYVPELGRSVQIKVSAVDIKTIDKIGLVAFLQKQGLSIKSVRKF